MAQDYTITATDIQDQVRHNLNTPPNGYLGSDYGSDVKSMTQTPQSSGVANSFISKLKTDVPLTAATGVNVYAENQGVDKKKLYVEVSGVGVVIAGDS